jgi:hypothetical protein
MARHSDGEILVVNGIVAPSATALCALARPEHGKRVGVYDEPLAQGG